MADTSSTSPFGHKRTMDHAGSSERQGQMKIKRLQMNDISDSDMNDSIDNMTSDDIFLPQSMQPQVTINESPRYDATSVKREHNDLTVSQPQSPSNAFSRSYRECFERHFYMKHNEHFCIFSRTQKAPIQMPCKALPIRITFRISRTPTWRCRTKWNRRFTWIFLQVRNLKNCTIPDLVYVNSSLSFIARRNLLPPPSSCHLLPWQQKFSAFLWKWERKGRHEISGKKIKKYTVWTSLIEKFDSCFICFFFFHFSASLTAADVDALPYFLETTYQFSKRTK